MSNEYVSYEDLDEYQKLEVDEGGTSDDVALLRGFCTTASWLWDTDTRRTFYPRLETRYYDHPADPTWLKVDDDLLEVTAFTTQNGDDAVDAADYYLMCGHSYNLMPYDRLVMVPDGDVPVLLYSDRLQKANAVTGIWGYHESWADAWPDSGDTVQDDPLTLGATTLTVAGVDGKDIYGITPRFKVQMLLRIDDEYLYTVAKNASAETLAVIRGVNGTTAAEHANGTTVYVYQPMEDVAHAVKRLAAWLYAQRNTPFTEQMASVEIGGTIVIPRAAPADVLAAAARRRR